MAFGVYPFLQRPSLPFRWQEVKRTVSKKTIKPAAMHNDDVSPHRYFGFVGTVVQVMRQWKLIYDHWDLRKSSLAERYFASGTIHIIWMKVTDEEVCRRDDHRHDVRIRVKYRN